MLSIVKRHIFNEEEEFRVHLLSVDEDMKEYYLQLSEQYAFLNETKDSILFLIRSKGYDREVIVDSEDVNRCIDVVIADLLQYEMYEQCNVLKNVKQEFNDNKR